MAEFGRHLRSEWLLDPAVTYLNHGTVGATPRRVLARQREIQDEIERQPARFLYRELDAVLGAVAPETSRLHQALAAVAPRLGADVADLVFVDNITAGANAALRSVPLGARDEIAVTTLGYGGVTNTAAYAARERGGALRTIDVPGLGADAAMIRDAVIDGLTPRTRVLVIDHLSANTALILPVAEIAAACHDRGVLVFADGAHAPGQLAVDIPALGVDWYAANLHKWAWAPRSCGILWTAPAHQAALHAPVVSWGLDRGMAAEFGFMGTRDLSPFLAAPFAFELLDEFGAAAVRSYNHDLVWWAAEHVSGQWGTEFSTLESMIGSMATVRLPAPLGTSEDDARRVRAELLDAGFDVPVAGGAAGLTTRIAAQIYCARDDFTRLADAVAAVRPVAS